MVHYQNFHKLPKMAFGIASLFLFVFLVGCGLLSGNGIGIDEYMRMGDFQIRVVRAYPWVSYQIDPNTQDLIGDTSILVVEVEILVPQVDDFTIIQGWRPSVEDKNGDLSPEVQARPEVKYSTDTLDEEWITGYVQWIFNVDASLSPFTLIIGNSAIPLESFFEVESE